MDTKTSTDLPARGPSPGPVEFIAIIAIMMALTGLSIDMMLPALSAIGEAYGLSDPNQRQLVVTSYVLGFSVGQLTFGPLSDAYGRKPMLFLGLCLFAIATLGTVLAGDFDTLLVARLVQGFGCGAPRVIAIAVVRDLYGGRRMARVMSFVLMVFIIVPVLAPSLGEGFMLLGHWQWIFLSLLAISLLLLLATMLRLPETCPPEARAPFSLRWLLGALREIVTERQTLGYTVATGFVFGCLLSYITSAQQIFVDVYKLGSLFPVVFGSISAALALAGGTNAHFVQRIGMRRLSHGALVGFLLASLLNLASTILLPQPPPLALFSALLALTFFCFGFVMPNFNALAMEPLQRIAGTGSSFFGFFTTASAAILGWAVGQQFDGTVMPLTAGYTLLSAVSLGIVFVTERGRLFQPHTPE